MSILCDPIICINSTKHFFSFRKVAIMEDLDHNIHLKNLSMQQSINEEEALKLLFLGDTNRVIAEVRDETKIF